MSRVPTERQKRLKQRLRRLVKPAWLGTLRRTERLTRGWGSERGTPLDRYYIEQFLERHRADVRGRVLEVQESRYTDRYGFHPLQREVLDVLETNPNATIVADLAAADSVESDQFDCFILTQTLQLVYDVHSAVRHAHRILRPGGVLLATVPCLSVLAGLGGDPPDYWRFTPEACTRLFGDVFGPDRITVRAYGNVLTATAFLMGMAHEELTRKELEAHDPILPILVSVRAEKG